MTSLKNTIRNTVLAGSVALGLGLMATSALANSLINTAKASCTIGEQNNGYLGVVPGASASDAVRREMRSVNQKRKAVYEQLAARNGVTVDVAAVLTAEKLARQAASGHCVQDPTGAWSKK